MAGGHVEYDGGRLWHQEAGEGPACCCCTRAGRTAAGGTGTWSGSRRPTKRSASTYRARAPRPSPTSRTCPTTCSSGCWPRWGSAGRRWWGCRPAAGWRSTSPLSGRSGPGRWWWSPLVHAASMTSRRTRACRRSPRRSWRGTGTAPPSCSSRRGCRCGPRPSWTGASAAWSTTASACSGSGRRGCSRRRRGRRPGGWARSVCRRWRSGATATARVGPWVGDHRPLAMSNRPSWRIAR
jgi:hypothetical protein